MQKILKYYCQGNIEKRSLILEKDIIYLYFLNI